MCEKDEIIEKLKTRIMNLECENELLRKAKLSVAEIIIRDSNQHGTIRNILSTCETERGIIVICE